MVGCHRRYPIADAGSNIRPMTVLWRTLLLAWLASAWIAGAATAALFGYAALPISLAVAFGMLALALVRRAPHYAALALVLPLLFAVSVLRYEATRPHLSPDSVAHYNDGVSMRLRGVLRDDPQVGDTSQRLVVDARSVQQRDEWPAASGGIEVRTGLLPSFRSGDVIELEGKLESPTGEAGFDYAAYLAARGIISTMAYPSVRVVGHEDDSLMRASVLHVRRSLSHALALALPEPQASLAQGVLLGQRSALPADLKSDLNATNTSHLVVVSGANIVLVSAYATVAFMWLVDRRRARLLSITAVIAYAMLIGPSPPVLRAVVMGILLVLAAASGRRSHGLTALLFAAALMIGLDPQVVRDISFQLSFAATAGIMFLAPPIRKHAIELIGRAMRTDEVPRSLDGLIAEPLAVTLAAIVATAPLLALNFGRVSLVAIPANLLIVPAFGPILAASLLAALGGMLPAGRLIFAAPAYYLLTYWIDVAAWFAGRPHAALDVGAYTSRWAALTYAAVAAGCAVLARYAPPPAVSRLAESRPRDWRRVRSAAVIAIPAVAMVASLGFILRPAASPQLRVTVLDVGQGDAILVRTPAGQDIVIDGGPGGAVLRGLGDELPWTDRDIELMLLTHPQSDHTLGLLDVLARYDVRRVLAGPGAESSTTYRTWRDAVAAEGLDLETVGQGSSYDLGAGVRLDVLAPGAAMAADAQINNTGAVVRISWRDVSFLLAADIEAKAERALLDSGVDLHATVLKVAHHGSDTSSTTAFLDAVSPELSVISSGADNPYGLPSRDVVCRLSAYGAVYNTATSGSVVMQTDGHTLTIDAGPPLDAGAACTAD